MSTPIDSIRNLGPASVAGFARAGLHSAEVVRELGTDEVYLRLLKAGSSPHFIGYYALEMGLQGRAWNDATPDEKAKLRQRFDQIKAMAGETVPTGIESELNKWGVGTRRS